MTTKKDFLEIKPVKAKYLPVRCVVCGGFGHVSNQHITCHGCQGRGFILVETKDEEVIK